jgi:threonylcarbamoyladenosine tRNA methylthiotransferase MtaB
VTVTGCHAQISPAETAALPGVARVVSNQDKDQLVTIITGQKPEACDLEPILRENQLGAVGRTRAFVKVQDGCDNACTFCVTTIARGAGRSRPLAEALSEIQHLHALGYQEVVLTGVHLGSYGHDLGQRDGLTRLVRAIFDQTDLPRLRLSSLEPWDLSPDFFTLWDNPRLCRHLHLPLQSGCDSTLKRMLRRTSQAQFRALVQAARQRIPDIRITTDLIVGFPGENEAEFAISAAFVEEMDFAGIHVFRYSPRPGTAAARMRGQVAEPVRKQRLAAMLALAEAGERRFAERFSGRELAVLWEQIAGVEEAGFLNVGYTDNYIRVRCIYPRVLTDQITPARLQHYNTDTGQMQAAPVLTADRL